MGNKIENSIGELDYWVVKIDNFGNVIWDNIIGGIDREFIMDIFFISDGGYIMVGLLELNIFVDKIENNIGD